MAEVRLDNVSKTYRGGVEALRGFDLTVSDGELMVLAGSSGSGKTTTLRLIAGLERLTSGVISIDGASVSRASPRARGVAMVFQDAALYPHLTVRENLAFPLRARRMPREEMTRRTGAMARDLGLEAVLDRRPDALSGGQRQRAAIGRVLVVQPQCGLYDEPLSHLEPGLRRSIGSTVRTLHDASASTGLWVTHDQEEAMRLGDRIAVLHEGRLQQVGTPEELYRDPINRFVAAFFGSPSMNFVAAASVEIPMPAAATASGAVIGIRPEHLRVASGGEADLHARVESSRLLGASSEIAVRTDAGDVVHARLGPRDRPAVGSTIALAIDRDQVLVFDAAGDRLR